MHALVTPTKASHWYSRDGKPCHTVIGANGAERNTTLRDARKQGLYPSVTSVINMIANPGLDAWKQEQAILAALTLPPHENESLNDYAKRVVQDMDAQRDTSAVLGRRIHFGIDQLLNGQIPDPEMAPYLLSVGRWFDDVGLEMLLTETDMISHEWGFGGRLDLYGRIDGQLTLVDFKSQDVKRGKANFYDSWPIQLSAYRKLLQEKGLPIQACYSVVIDTNIAKPVHVEKWPEQKLSFETFGSALQIWKHLKNYDPLGPIPTTEE